MRIRRNSVILGILLIIILLIVVSTHKYVYAFGVSTPYLENDTITIEPGQEYDYAIKVQNGDTFPIEILLEHNNAQGVASLGLRNTTIPAQSYDEAFTFHITIPKRAIPGEVYILNYSIMPIVNLSGQVPMNIQIKRSLIIKIVNENGQGYSTNMIDRIKVWRVNNARIVKQVSYGFSAILILVLLTLIIARFWKISKKMSQQITTTHATPSTTRSLKTINECTTTEEVLEVITLMSPEAFALEEVRILISLKLEKLGERFLSQKILTIKDKETFNAIING